MPSPINNIIIIDGLKTVLINNIIFKSRRNIDWNYIESLLKCQIGKHYDILETSERIYIGTDFPDEYDDYSQKHKNKAKFGWFRYDTRFGIPVYNDNNELLRYNIFNARILVRRDIDGKLYLYDIVKIKKETSKPL